VFWFRRSRADPVVIGGFAPSASATSRLDARRVIGSSSLTFHAPLGASRAATIPAAASSAAIVGL